MSDVRVGEWSGVEQRRHRRVPLRVPIRCQSGTSVVEGKGVNISSTGLLVRVEKTYPQDEEITVIFSLPDSGQEIRSKARVAHVVPDEFMGLELLDLAEAFRQRIEQYIASAPRPSAV